MLPFQPDDCHVIIAAAKTEIVGPELEGRTQCLTLERIQVMLGIAVVPVEMAAAGAGSGSGLVEEEVEVVVHLVSENLAVAYWAVEVGVAQSQPSSRKVPFRTFLQHFD